MKDAHSISTRRAYGVQRVCRVWHRARSSVYARRQATTSRAPCRRRGPVGPSFFLKFVFEHLGGIVEQAELLRRYNQFWFARGTTVAGTRRTSLIVDPPAGRLPPYTREGEARIAAREEARRRNAGPEDRDVDERCILGFNSGPPMLPGAYNNFVQVFQGPGHVGDPQRDGARRPTGPAGRPSISAPADPPMERRLAWTVGG